MTTPPPPPRPARHLWRTAALNPTSNLPSPARLVICALAERMDDRHPTCWPALASLAAATGLSERSVREHLRRLEELGWLTVELGGGRRSSRYTAVIPTIPNTIHTPEPDSPHPGTSRPPAGQQMPPTPAGDAPRGAGGAPESAMNQPWNQSSSTPTANHTAPPDERDDGTRIDQALDELVRITESRQPKPPRNPTRWRATVRTDLATRHGPDLVDLIARTRPDTPANLIAARLLGEQADTLRHHYRQDPAA